MQGSDAFGSAWQTSVLVSTSFSYHTVQLLEDRKRWLEEKILRQSTSVCTWSPPGSLLRQLQTPSVYHFHLLTFSMLQRGIIIKEK